MSRVLTLSVTLAIVAGIVGGFVYGELSQEVTAQQAARILPVEEQNLDADGFIRVREQGTTDVNVVDGSVDVGNLPLDDQGNLRVATTNATKTHILAENGFIPLSGDAFGPVDITGCTRFAVILRARLGTPQATLENSRVVLGLSLGGPSPDALIDPTVLRVSGSRLYAAYHGKIGIDGELHEVFAPLAEVQVRDTNGFFFDTIVLHCLP